MSGGERTADSKQQTASDPERQRLALGRLNRLSRAELSALSDREARAVPHPLHLAEALRKLGEP